jgi:serine/threonine protein kinase
VVVIGALVDGRYRIVRRLGAGGMAEVFEATHVTTRRNVALKLVDLAAIEPAKREAYLARFAREARAASAVSAPHIAQVLDAGNDAESGAPYLAMELLSGSDLRETLKQLGALPEAVVSKIALQATRALVVAHERGIVHRDIKPANLFLHRLEDGEIIVKLVDFGVAKLVDDRLVDPETSELTRTGTLLGTPHYMSPEQLLQTRSADHRSDIWSLGVVMYKMLLGETPFERAASMGLTVLAICAEPIVPLTRRAPWLASELAGLVDRCLERDVARRIPNARELLDLLSTLPGAKEPLRENELVGLPPELVARLTDQREESERDATGVLRNDAETTAITLSTASPPEYRPSTAPQKRSSLRWFVVATVLGVLGTSAGFGLMQREQPRTLESVQGRHPLGLSIPAATPASPPSVASDLAPSAKAAPIRGAKPVPRASAAAPAPAPKPSGVGLRDKFD